MSILINNVNKCPFVWATKASESVLRKPCIYRNVGSYPVIIEPEGPINNNISTWNSNFDATTPSNSIVAKTCFFRLRYTGAPGIFFNSSSGTWSTRYTDEIALTTSQNPGFVTFRLCQNPSNITTIFEQGVNPASPGIFQQTKGSDTYTIYPYKWIDNSGKPLTCIFSMDVLIESSKYISINDLAIGCYVVSNNATKYINLTDYSVKYSTSTDTDYFGLSSHQTYQFGSKYLSRIVINNHTANGFLKSFNTVGTGQYYYITDPEIIYLRSAGNPEFGNGDYIQINSFSITSQFIPSHRYVSG
jgi:hypothetical protein